MFDDHQETGHSIKIKCTRTEDRQRSPRRTQVPWHDTIINLLSSKTHQPAFEGDGVHVELMDQSQFVIHVFQ